MSCPHGLPTAEGCRTCSGVTQCPACGATELGAGHKTCPRCGSAFGYTTTKEANPKDAAGQAKLPLGYFSPVARAHWTAAMQIGRLKYGATNWAATGVAASVYLDALHRHIDAWVSGEEVDPVDGTHHLGHVMACASILLDAAARGKLVDDRPPRVDLRAVQAALEPVLARAREQYKDRTPRHYTIADSAPAPLSDPGTFLPLKK